MTILLALAAGATGALAGFVVGAAWTGFGLPGASEPVAALVVAVAVVLDLVGRPRPAAVHRQVPQAWARVFPIRVAAVLYGARLGVGPLTILSTWLWWAAFVLGATAGPWWSSAVGAAFGLGRVAVMVAVSARVEGDMSARMAQVRGRERVGRPLALVGAVVAVAVLLAACTSGGDKRSADRNGGDDDGRGTSTSAAPPPPTIPASPVNGALMLDDLGPDWTRVPDTRAGLGPLDLEAAAKAEVDTSAERSLLETRGFKAGLARAWRNQAGDELYQAVYEFRDEASAAAYLQDGLINLEGRGSARYEVEGVPGATGFSQAERRPDGAVTSHGLAFVRGHRFFLLFLASARPGTTPAAVAEFGRAADAKRAASAAPA
ncbi:MAG TPA: hypothetical protein VM938_01525 [Acidimicrobiales bacterium]|nr:hypothetical protein [Acidimicrobiales bacterium]